MVSPKIELDLNFSSFWSIWAGWLVGLLAVGKGIIGFLGYSSELYLPRGMSLSTVAILAQGTIPGNMRKHAY